MTPQYTLVQIQTMGYCQPHCSSFQVLTEGDSAAPLPSGADMTTSLRAATVRTRVRIPLRFGDGYEVTT
jgi:hypothetical protein